MAVLNNKKHTAMWGGIDVKTRSALQDAVIRFDLVNTAPTTATGHRYLYVDTSGRLTYDNGSATTIIGAAGAAATTWETLFANDSTLALTTTTAFTMTQSAAGGMLVLTKTNTGAGVPLTINNAGTGIDLQLTKTEGSSTGIVLNTFHNSPSAADADVIFEHLVRAADDGQASVSFGRVRFLADDVSAGTEDATYQLALMVEGTSRTALAVTGPTVTIGDGASNAVLTTSGALDLTISTNAGTNSGTIRIYDGANGNIELLNNGSGDVTIPTSGIIQGGTTPTRCTFATTGTTGDGFYITDADITSGNVFHVNHSSGATFNGGFLIAASVASSNVFTVGEDGAVVIGGTAASSALTLSAGNFVMSDGTVAITSTATTDVFAITANSLLANNALIVAGSGTFTGTGTSSFVAITPTGATTGTGLYIALAAATTLSYAVDVTTSTTTGIAARLTNTGILTGVGAALSIIADSATTAGNSTGEGVVNVSVDGLTTGCGLNVESISNELMTSGQLADFAHTAVGTTIAAKTGALIRVTSSMTESGTSTQDFDMVSVVRTSVHDTAGTLTATGSLMYLENIATETGATLTDTTNGLEVVMGATGTGDGVKITHSGTTGGRSLNIAASTTTGTVALLTMNALTTTGVGLSLTNTGTGLTSGSVLRVASGTTSAVATNGVISLFATGAFTSTAVTDGFIRVNANSTTSGTAMALNLNGAITALGLYLGDTGTGMTSGSLVRAVSASTAAVATNGILSVQATGAYTSTANMGILAAIANTTTAGTVAYVSATSMIGGTLLFLNATAATLTGKYIQCYDGAADDFSVGQYGATIIAGNASGTAALTLSAGNITLTSGNILLTAGTIIETAQAILNANTAISVTHGVTKIANNGASTHTLADGVEGQKKTIVCTVYAGDAVITPANLANGTTITLNAVNDACDLVFLGTEWFVTNLYLTAAVGA